MKPLKALGRALPTPYRRRAVTARNRALATLYHGGAVECPICEGRFRAFRAPRQVCPGCGAFPRHRLFWLFLEDRLPSRPGARVLHVSPEYGIERRFQRMGIEYITGDLMPGAMVQLDVMALPFADEQFDLVICNHVLPCVPDDDLAMRELYRVLVPQGRLLMQNPVDYAAEGTIGARVARIG
jgi:hypothetical protein